MQAGIATTLIAHGVEVHIFNHRSVAGILRDGARGRGAGGVRRSDGVAALHRIIREWARGVVPGRT